jgi:Tfp pilus assembly protein PilF
MRHTSSFAVFRPDPGERGLARPRWLARDGKPAEAEAEYRAALRADPDLASGWTELFELLRRQGRHADALELAGAAEGHWGPDAALPLTLRGAALVELGRLGEGIAALQDAIRRDDTSALAWHEYGYASYRAGHHSEALLALDRAFALEPHTDTLMLRGRILREGGRYDAAEVAFEGALQATEHDVPRREAEREIAATRRAAALGGGRRPRDFTARERWFVRDAGVLLIAGDASGDAGGRAAAALAALAGLVRALDWRPGAVAGASSGDAALAGVVAAGVGARAVAVEALGPPDRPLLVTAVNRGSEAWGRQLDRLARWRCGYTVALFEAPDAPDPADVVGVGDVAPERDAGAAGLRDAPAPVEPDAEALGLARQPLAGWQQRTAGPPPG